MVCNIEDSDASSIDATWWGLQPHARFLASENGVFGCCWCWIFDVLELLFMQVISGRSDCKLFLEAQGDKVMEIVVFHDNQSSMKLETNG